MSVEWEFSISGNIVTNKRSCLKPSNVDMSIFSRGGHSGTLSRTAKTGHLESLTVNY